jgi:hypothetical protein
VALALALSSESSGSRQDVNNKHVLDDLQKQPKCESSRDILLIPVKRSRLSRKVIPSRRENDDKKHKYFVCSPLAAAFNTKTLSLIIIIFKKIFKNSIKFLITSFVSLLTVGNKIKWFSLAFSLWSTRQRKLRRRGSTTFYCSIFLATAQHFYDNLNFIVVEFHQRLNKTKRARKELSPPLNAGIMTECGAA